MNILFSSEGPFENILKFKPPMAFDAGNAKDLTDALATTFSELRKMGPLELPKTHHLRLPIWQKRMMGLDFNVSEDDEEVAVNGNRNNNHHNAVNGEASLSRAGRKRKASPSRSPGLESGHGSMTTSPLISSEEDDEVVLKKVVKKRKVEEVDIVDLMDWKIHLIYK